MHASEKYYRNFNRSALSYFWPRNNKIWYHVIIIVMIRNLQFPTVKNFLFLEDSVFRLVQFWMYFHKLYPNSFIWFYFHFDPIDHLFLGQFGKIIISPEVSDHFRQEYIAWNLVPEYFSCCYYKLIISFSVRFHK